MYNHVIRRMAQAKLGRSTEGVLMHLLDHVDQVTGRVILSMAAFLALVQVTNRGSALRYLSRLKRVGIIRYHTDGEEVFITFLGWGEVEDGTRSTRMDADLEGGLGLMGVVERLCAQVGMLGAQFGEMERRLAEAGIGEGAREETETARSFEQNQQKYAQFGDESRALSPQQTEVCLLVNTTTPPGDLNNKQTEPVTNCALEIAHEEPNRCVALGKCLAPPNEETSENDNAKDARHLSGATHQGVRDAQMTESSRKGSVQSPPTDQRPDPFLEDGASTTPPTIPPDEQDRTFKLLTDPEIGVSDRAAKNFAQSRGFDYVRRQVFAWQKEMAVGKVEGVGALVHRIRMGFGAPEPTMAQQESALYQRHRTSFEVEAEEKAKESYRAMMDEQDKAQSQPQPQAYPLLTPVAPEIWEQTMTRLHKEFYGNAIFTNFVQPMRLLGVHNGVHVIGLPNEQLRYHAQQYTGIVRRTLGSFVDNHQVPIVFEVVKVNREKGLFKAGDYVGQIECLQS